MPKLKDLNEFKDGRLQAIIWKMFTAWSLEERRTEPIKLNATMLRKAWKNKGRLSCIEIFAYWTHINRCNPYFVLPFTHFTWFHRRYRFCFDLLIDSHLVRRSSYRVRMPFLVNAWWRWLHFITMRSVGNRFKIPFTVGCKFHLQ